MVLHNAAGWTNTLVAVRIQAIRPSCPSHGLFAAVIVLRSGIDLVPQGGGELANTGVGTHLSGSDNAQLGPKYPGSGTPSQRLSGLVLNYRHSAFGLIAGFRAWECYQS